MYYKTKVKDYVRLPPASFGDDIELALTQEIKKKYNGFISQELGFVIDVTSVDNVGQGIILPGDGSARSPSEQARRLPLSSG